MIAPDDLVEVLAVGNAIVDVLVHCEDTVLEELGFDKGTMSLVDAAQAAEIYETIGPGIEVSGGSAANTAAGVASLGGLAGFVGKVADDELGKIFIHDLRATGVTFDTAPATAGPPTARCFVLVTPDGQRTMATHLGVAGELAARDVDSDLVGRSRITFVEGYLVGLPTAASALRSAVDAAHASGGRLALTLSDPMWVEAQREAFTALLSDVDILLANEHEACQLTGEPDAESAVKALRRSCSVVAVTRSEHGALVADQTGMFAVPARPVARVIDTTGAGDLFAAGFLHGLAHELNVVDSARLGTMAAAEVIGHLGARPEVRLAEVADASR